MLWSTNILMCLHLFVVYYIYTIHLWYRLRKQMYWNINENCNTQSVLLTKLSLYHSLSWNPGPPLLLVSYISHSVNFLIVASNNQDHDVKATTDTHSTSSWSDCKSKCTLLFQFKATGQAHPSAISSLTTYTTTTTTCSGTTANCKSKCTLVIQLKEIGHSTG